MSLARAVPLSAHELRDAVRQSRPFDPARLDRVLRTDVERGVLEVQAGTPWARVAAHLRPGDEDAARVGAGLPTVGASIAWNAAGPDGRPAIGHVESLTLVTPDGELRRASRAANAELFALAVGGQNLFGSLYSVTLRIDSLLRSLGEATPEEAPAAQETRGATRGLRLLVPPDAVDPLMARLRETCDAWRVGIARLRLRRTKQDEETFLHWARRPYVQVSLRLAVPVTLGGAVRTEQLCRELIGASIATGGSFSIAHTTEASREQAEACYPELRRFLAEKRRLDPAEKLSTPWYRHYRNLLGRASCESRWNR
jgi:hypothetical protein